MVCSEYLLIGQEADEFHVDLGLAPSDSVVHGSEGGAVDLELVPPVRLLCLSWRRRGERG